MKILLLLLFINFIFHFEGVAQLDDLNITTSLDSLLNTKISSASKYWQTTFEAPSSVSIISSEDLEKFGYQTLGEALASLGGFYLSYDRNYSYLGVRGFSRPTDYNNRVLILLNDHPLNENVFGSSSIGTELGVSIAGIERIEIVRGPGSSLYGTGAMFSVINIVTKDGNNFDKTTFAVTGGSQKDYSVSLNYGGSFFDDLKIFLSAKYFNQLGKNIYFQEFDDASTNSGLAVDLDKDNYSGFGALINFKRLKFQMKYSARKKHIPTAPYGIDFNHPQSLTEDNFGFIELEYFLPIKSYDHLNFKVSLDQYDYAGDYPYSNSILTDEAMGRWALFNIQYHSELSSSSKLIAGFEYKDNLESRYRVFTASGELFNKNILSSVKSFYVQNEYQPLAFLTLLASLRYDGYSGEPALFSPRGAIVYTPMKHSAIKLVYGTSYRTPNTYELYYEDAATNFKSNSELESENITTIELICEQKLYQILYGTISFYNYRVSNLIDQYFNDSDSSLQFINLSKATANGVELNFNYFPQNNIKTFFRYSYQYARDDEKKSHLSNSPKHLLRAGAAVPVYNLFSIAPELSYEKNRQTVYGNHTGDFIKLNLTIASQPIIGNLSFSLAIKNLFNTTYSYPGGYEHFQSSIVQDGRNFIAKCQYEF